MNGHETGSPGAVGSGRSLLIGIGNEHRRDDGIGVAVARHVGSLRPDHVTVTELRGDAASLLVCWEGAERVVVVDAVRSDGRPGTVLRFDANAQTLPRGMSGCSTHGLGLVEAVELARHLSELPPTLVVYGIIGARFDPGNERSPAVNAVIEEVADCVLQEFAGITTPRSTVAEGARCTN